MNAAVWFGASIYLFVLLQLGIFSPEMEHLLQRSYKAYSGAIAQIAFKQFFHLQLWCAWIAVAHLLAVWLYLGRPLQRLNVWLVLGLLALSLLGNFLFQPRMERLHGQKYGVRSTVEERQAAERSFPRWHGLSQVMNLLVWTGLIAYLWRLSHPVEAPRFVSTAKFRG